MLHHLFLDTAPYFTMIAYSERIPDHSAIDTWVIDLYFNDTDYGDWFVDYQPEYDNEDYFYYDTRSSMYY